MYSTTIQFSLVKNLVANSKTVNLNVLGTFMKGEIILSEDSTRLSRYVNNLCTNRISKEAWDISPRLYLYSREREIIQC